MSRITLADRAAAATEKVRTFLDDSNVLSKARAFVAGDAQFFSEIPKPEQMRQQLASDSISEKKDGMKRVIVGLCKGNDMSDLFPDVVKNIHAPSIELRKLIYFYIVHYAADRPNESLLSISAFQRDLQDTSMHVRSLALRTLSALRIPAIQPVVMIAARKGAVDGAPIVRKTAAIALAQANSTGGDNKEELVKLLQGLLGDRAPEVVGAAMLSYLEICPNHPELLHRYYRRICKLLPMMDEWGQVVTLHALLRYARTQFSDPDPPSAKHCQNSDEESINSDITTPDSSASESSSDYGDKQTPIMRLDSDHRLLINSAKELLGSMNRAVTIAAVAVLFHIAPRSELDVVVKPLLRLLNAPSDGHIIALSVIHTISLKRPELFIPFIKDFLLHPADSEVACQLKIQLIAALTRPESIVLVTQEFRTYLRSFDRNKVIIALRGLALVIANTAAGARPGTILELIVPLLGHRDSAVVTEAVVVLRHLVACGAERGCESDIAQIVKLLLRLVMQLMRGEVYAPAAKASIIWLVSENISSHAAIAKAAPDCFRVLARSFTSEDSLVRAQALTLGAKLWFYLGREGDTVDRFKKMFFYVLELSKYDLDYELRDQSRLLESLIDRDGATYSAVRAAMLAPKPLPRLRDPNAERARFQLGSLSHLCGTSLLGYVDLPKWPTTPTSSHIRDAVEERAASDGAAKTPSVSVKPANDLFGSSSSTSSTMEDDDEDNSYGYGKEDGEADEESSVSYSGSAIESSHDSSSEGEGHELKDPDMGNEESDNASDDEEYYVKPQKTIATKVIINKEAK